MSEELFQRTDDWIERLSHGAVQPDWLKAIYIGIFESEPNYQLYLFFSKEYDPEDDDWACPEDQDQEYPYLDSGIAVEDMTWERFLDEVIAVLETMVDQKRDSVLQWDVPVCVGFDGGDLVRLT